VPQRPGAFDADDAAPRAAAAAAPAAAPNGVDDATVAARTRELLLTDGEIRRQYDKGALTVSTSQRAVATELGVDEDAIKDVVKATLADYLHEQMQQRCGRIDCLVCKGGNHVRDQPCPNTAAVRAAAARYTRRRSFCESAEQPPAARDDGSDSDVGAYFELSD